MTDVRLDMTTLVRDDNETPVQVVVLDSHADLDCGCGPESLEILDTSWRPVALLAMSLFRLLRVESRVIRHRVAMHDVDVLVRLIKNITDLLGVDGPRFHERGDVVAVALVARVVAIVAVESAVESVHAFLFFFLFFVFTSPHTGSNIRSRSSNSLFLFFFLFFVFTSPHAVPIHFFCFLFCFFLFTSPHNGSKLRVTCGHERPNTLLAMHNPHPWTTHSASAATRTA